MTEIIPIDSSTYNATLSSNYARITLGGSIEKFVPNVNMWKWDNKTYLNINHPDVVTDERERFLDGKIELTVGENTHRMYLVGEELEYEIEFQRRPPTDLVEYSIQFSNDLSFHKQVLTPEQILDGHSYSRPDAEGSYAVYHTSKKNGKYKTGKFCHIYCPKLIDANKNESICAIDINPVTMKMVVTMDKAWLDNAVYPVILDPILGYDSVGVLSSVFPTNTYYYSYQTDAAGGIIQNFNIATGVSTALGGFKMAVANTNQTTKDPEGFSLVEECVGTVASDTTIQVAAAGTEVLTASTWYSIGLCFEDSTNDKIRYDASPTGTRWYYARTYANEVTDPVPTTSTQTIGQLSMWVEYLPTSNSNNIVMLDGD